MYKDETISKMSELIKVGMALRYRSTKGNDLEKVKKIWDQKYDELINIHKK